MVVVFILLETILEELGSKINKPETPRLSRKEWAIWRDVTEDADKRCWYMFDCGGYFPADLLPNVLHNLIVLIADI